MTDVAHLIHESGKLSLSGLIRHHARYHAERIAVEDERRLLTYGELEERANRIANALLAAGLKRGDRIAALMENRCEFVEIEVAAAKLGLIVAALNWRLTDEELRHCIELVTPSLFFVSGRYTETLVRLGYGGDRLIDLDRDFEAMLRATPAKEAPNLAQPEDGLIILYTSGTTGMPKGALISQRAVIARSQIFYHDLRLDEADAFVAWAPFFHMVSNDHAMATLIHGGRVIVIDGFQPDKLVETVSRHRIGWFVVMPGMIERLAEELKKRQTVPAGIKAIGAMADLVPRHQLAEITTLLRAPYVNSFGATETGLAPASKNFVAIGTMPERLPKEQSSYCEIRLVDEDDVEVPDGEPGELAIRGPSLFSGYWQNRETNAKDFRHGWFHMGDVFVRHPDGTLEFVDRRKYLIKSGGENIYPAEIERVLLADPRIDEAVVVRRRDPHWGEVPVAFVVPRDPSLTVEDVLALCEGKLARYKFPKEIRFITHEEVPRSTTGKVQRHHLEVRLKEEKRSI